MNVDLVVQTLNSSEYNTPALRSKASLVLSINTYVELQALGQQTIWMKVSMFWALANENKVHLICTVKAEPILQSLVNDKLVQN